MQPHKVPCMDNLGLESVVMCRDEAVNKVNTPSA